VAFTVPNLDKIQKDDPKLGEALQKIQKTINQNTNQAPGNRQAPPIGIVNPTQIPG
jgi:hypothetical protein